MNFLNPQGKRKRAEGESVHPLNPIAAKLYANNTQWMDDVGQILDDDLMAQLAAGNFHYVKEKLAVKLAEGPIYFPSDDELIEFRARTDSRGLFDFGEDETAYQGYNY